MQEEIDPQKDNLKGQSTNMQIVLIRCWQKFVKNHFYSQLHLPLL